MSLVMRDDDFQTEETTVELVLTERDQDMHARAALSAQYQRARNAERSERAS